MRFASGINPLVHRLPVLPETSFLFRKKTWPGFRVKCQGQLRRRCRCLEDGITVQRHGSTGTADALQPDRVLGCWGHHGVRADVPLQLGPFWPLVWHPCWCPGCRYGLRPPDLPFPSSNCSRPDTAISIRVKQFQRSCTCSDLRISFRILNLRACKKPLRQRRQWQKYKPS